MEADQPRFSQFETLVDLFEGEQLLAASCRKVLHGLGVSHCTAGIRLEIQRNGLIRREGRSRSKRLGIVRAVPPTNTPVLRRHDICPDREYILIYHTCVTKERDGIDACTNVRGVRECNCY